MNYNGPAWTKKETVVAANAIKVETGFIVGHVMIVNSTTAAKYDFTNSMANAGGIKTVAAGTTSIVSDGITINDGSDGAVVGFTIPAGMVDFNDANDEVLDIVAYPAADPNFNA